MLIINIRIYLHLSNEFPVNSTVKVTITLVIFKSAHIIHVLVFTMNVPPEGTSGVLVDVTTVTKLLNKIKNKLTMS